MKKQILTLLGIFVFAGLTAQEKLDYFLPSEISYNQAIQAPDDFFGQLCTLNEIFSYRISRN